VAEAGVGLVPLQRGLHTSSAPAAQLCIHSMTVSARARLVVDRRLLPQDSWAHTALNSRSWTRAASWASMAADGPPQSSRSVSPGWRMQDCRCRGRGARLASDRLDHVRHQPDWATARVEGCRPSTNHLSVRRWSIARAGTGGPLGVQQKPSTIGTGGLTDRRFHLQAGGPPGGHAGSARESDPEAASAVWLGTPGLARQHRLLRLIADSRLPVIAVRL